MKKILKLSLVCAVLFATSNAFAIDGNDNLNVHVLKGNGKVITFALNQVKKANVAIYDKNGELIYSESASGKEGILRTFSLEQFPEGKYYLEVEDSTKKVKHEIIVTVETSVLSSKAVSTIYKAGSAKNTSVAVR